MNDEGKVTRKTHMHAHTHTHAQARAAPPPHGSQTQNHHYAPALRSRAHPGRTGNGLAQALLRRRARQRPSREPEVKPTRSANVNKPRVRACAHTMKCVTRPRRGPEVGTCCPRASLTNTGWHTVPPCEVSAGTPANPQRRGKLEVGYRELGAGGERPWAEAVSGRGRVRKKTAVSAAPHCGPSSRHEPVRSGVAKTLACCVCFTTTGYI